MEGGKGEEGSEVEGCPVEEGGREEVPEDRSRVSRTRPERVFEVLYNLVQKGQSLLLTTISGDWKCVRFLTNRYGHMVVSTSRLSLSIKFNGLLFTTPLMSV